MEINCIIVIGLSILAILPEHVGDPAVLHENPGVEGFDSHHGAGPVTLPEYHDGIDSTLIIGFSYLATVVGDCAVIESNV